MIDPLPRADVIAAIEAEISRIARSGTEDCSPIAGMERAIRLVRALPVAPAPGETGVEPRHKVVCPLTGCDYWTPFNGTERGRKLAQHNLVCHLTNKKHGMDYHEAKEFVRNGA